MKVCWSLFKKYENYGNKMSRKGNTKLSARQRGQVRHEATKNCLTARQIRDKLELPITR